MNRYREAIRRARDQIEEVFGQEIEYQRDGMPPAMFTAVPSQQEGSGWLSDIVSPDEQVWTIRVCLLYEYGFKQPQEYDRIIDEEGRVWRVLAKDGLVWQTIEVDAVDIRVNTKLWAEIPFDSGETDKEGTEEGESDAD